VRQEAEAMHEAEARHDELAAGAASGTAEEAPAPDEEEEWREAEAAMEMGIDEAKLILKWFIVRANSAPLAL